MFKPSIISKGDGDKTGPRIPSVNDTSADL